MYGVKKFRLWALSCKQLNYIKQEKFETNSKSGTDGVNSRKKHSANSNNRFLVLTMLFLSIR